MEDSHTWMTLESDQLLPQTSYAQRDCANFANHITQVFETAKIRHLIISLPESCHFYFLSCEIPLFIILLLVSL